jgi:hypothetical protein
MRLVAPTVQTNRIDVKEICPHDDHDITSILRRVDGTAGSRNPWDRDGPMIDGH